MLLLKTLLINDLFLIVFSYNYYDYQGFHDGSEKVKNFVNEWAVQIEGGEEIAQLVALELGYVYSGTVSGFQDTYVFLKSKHSKQRRTSSRLPMATLVQDRRVQWAEQLFAKSRVKRYTIPPNPDQPLMRIKRVEENSTMLLKKREYGDLRNELFNDELWGREWYLQDTRTVEYLPRLDLNVLPVYEMGFNGSGVRVSVLDDGIEHNHTDLRDNYDPEISWDCNGGDPDPTPRYSLLMRNSHGTRCAGEIAMTANNRKCGVGVAWGAKVGGVRMLDGRITDRIEGEAIGYAIDKVDIYSASWGPNDDGRTVEGPGRLALQALRRGIKQGRGGKGAIYVWANGNGGGHNDNCNCDGYTSSIFTISIGSASQHGLFPWYGEICSSTLAAAYSSGAYTDQKIATTDIRDSCTVNHTGTSAAAPLAAGIIALVLQANPDLTWRDIQHLIVWTSEYAPLSANPGWQVNGVGLRFDIRFGFGLMNAAGLVKAALNWKTVPEKSICRVKSSSAIDKAVLSSSENVEVMVLVENCIVNYMEHVEVIANIQYSRRGALQISAISPQGTKVQLLSPRILDASTAGFVNWPLMSVGTWGENPNGLWRIIIEDKTNEKNTGTIDEFTLIVHGTNKIPEHMKNGPRKYSYDYNYQEVFDYFDNIRKKGDSNTDAGHSLNVQGAQTYGEIDLNMVDPIIEAEVKKEMNKLYKYY